MYLSVDCDTRVSVEMYVRSCDADGAPSEAALRATVAGVAEELSRDMLAVARRWRPRAALHLPEAPASDGEDPWVLARTERVLRAAGFHAVELDAIYQHVSEAAEQPPARAAVARRLADPAGS